MILSNILIDFFIDGGPIMYPILVVAVAAVCIIVERTFWWLTLSSRRDSKLLDKVYAALETGDSTEAIALSEKTRDPVVRIATQADSSRRWTRL